MIAHRLGIKSDMVGLPGEAFDRQSMQNRIENRHFELKKMAVLWCRLDRNTQSLE
jgi:hypothetical protein